MNKLAEYTNGNVNVTIYEDGTKVREYDDAQPIIVSHPESMDIKITNYCPLLCPMCHENSTIHGKHADLEKLKEVLGELRAGVECSLGGGDPLSHPQLIPFLEWCRDKGLIPSITINQQSINEDIDLIHKLINEKLIYGLGVSIVNEDDLFNVAYLATISPNVVCHIIAGIHDEETIKAIIKNVPNPRILILGYKVFGRGISYFTLHPEIESKIEELTNSITSYIGKCVLCFDNLAIKQLDLQKKLNGEIWDDFYMGDDFTFTMYIDAVNEQYAETSTGTQRTSFADMSLLEYFTRDKRRGLCVI